MRTLDADYNHRRPQRALGNQTPKENVGKIRSICGIKTGGTNGNYKTQVKSVSIIIGETSQGLALQSGIGHGQPIIC